MKTILIWMIFSCIGCATLRASDRTIKGYVLDKEGIPLPGAMCMITASIRQQQTKTDISSFPCRKK